MSYTVVQDDFGDWVVKPTGQDEDSYHEETSGYTGYDVLEGYGKIRDNYEDK